MGELVAKGCGERVVFGLDCLLEEGCEEVGGAGGLSECVRWDEDNFLGGHFLLLFLGQLPDLLPLQPNDTFGFLRTVGSIKGSSPSCSWLYGNR